MVRSPSGNGPPQASRRRSAGDAKIPAGAHSRRTEAAWFCRRPAIRPGQHPLRDGFDQHQLWVAHNPTRHCFVATDGPVVLFDYFSCEHLSDHSGVVDEVRPAVSFMFMYGGELSEMKARRWAGGIADLVREHGGGNKRIAVDHLDPEGVIALAELGVTVGNGEAVMESARLIKSPDEILAMRRAIVACEAAMGEMQAALQPGLSENELWAQLHRGNIARGGEWIETRLLSSGPRTNPWFQECSSRRIEAGDLVAFDTDLIGPYGFCADLSRTWLCGDGEASDEQRALFKIAADQIVRNTELMQPGVGFRELVERSVVPPATVFRRAMAYSTTAWVWRTNTLPCRMRRTGPKTRRTACWSPAWCYAWRAISEGLADMRASRSRSKS